MDEGAAWAGADDEDEDDEGGAAYRALAREAIPALLADEHAAVWHEIEAKLAERPQPGAPRGINPHHLSNAARRLLADGVIEMIPATATRGGRVVSVWALKDRRRRKTAFERASGRKRLLEARYLGWAEGGGRVNVIGAAGERVTHASLLRATGQGVGYRIYNPASGQVDRLFGAPIPGGSFDNAARLIVPDDGEPPVVEVVVEVKNLRTWLYPSAGEIFQLLDKAARLQVAYPRRRFVPVLACRRAHYLTFTMAKHLGFLVVRFDAAAQPILPHAEVDPEALREVQDGLGYVFARTDDHLPGVTGGFAKVIPRQARATSERWKLTAAALAPHYGALRSESLSGAEREDTMARLARNAASIVRPERRWRAAQRDVARGARRIA